MRWRHKKARLRALLATMPDLARFSLRRRLYMQAAVRAGFRADDGLVGSAKERRQARRGLMPCDACNRPVNMHRDDRCRWCGAMPVPF